MSKSLDELLEKMEREKKPAMTIEQLRQLSNEDHMSQAAMNQAAQQMNAAQGFNGWPNLNNLGKQAQKVKNTMKTFTVRFEQTGEYEDETLEADCFIMDGSLVIFYNDKNEKIFTLPAGRLIYIKEEEQ